MKNQTNPQHNETKQATFLPTPRKSSLLSPGRAVARGPANPLAPHFPPPGPPPQLFQGERGWSNSLGISFLHSHPSPSLPKTQCLPPSHPEALTLAPRAPPEAPHSRVDDGHEMHQPQHQEEHEPEDGHSLQGQVQQRHPPARPGPLRPPPRTALPPEDRVGARRGGAGGERKVGRGRGGGGWGRKGRAGPARPARAPSFARCPGRVRGCGRCGGEESVVGAAAAPRSGSLSHTLAAPGRTLSACTPDANAPPPRRGTPGRAAPHPARPPQLRALIETGGQRSDSPARPASPPPSGTAAPASPRGGARRCSPPTLPPRARCVTVTVGSAPLGGCCGTRAEPAVPPRAPVSARASPSASGGGATGRQSCGSGAGLARRWRRVTLCRAQRLLALRVRLQCGGAPQGSTRSSRQPPGLSRNPASDAVSAASPPGAAQRGSGPPPGRVPGGTDVLWPSFLNAFNAVLSVLDHNRPESKIILSLRYL